MRLSPKVCGAAFAALLNWSGPVVAQVPPLPTGAADLFVPAIPGLTASDFCAGASCYFGTTNGRMFELVGSQLATDALGSVYLPPARILTGGTCTIGAFQQPEYETPIWRVPASAPPELVGTLRDDCGTDFWRHVDTAALAVDATNGVMYLHLNVAQVNGSGGVMSPVALRITGFPAVTAVVPQGLQGPPGPGGPSGPSGPPGPLLTPCPDADGDGFRDCTVPGCFPYGGACGDCDDHDREVNPAQSEKTPASHRHDGKDNDCNGIVDDWKTKK